MDKIPKKPNPEPEKEASIEMERYCNENPRSPTALRRPKIMLRGSHWITLLGSTLQDGIAGIGRTVKASLRAFDVQYRNSRKPRG